MTAGSEQQLTSAERQAVASATYDAASRLIRVEQGALFAALGYDNANRRTSLRYSNNTTTTPKVWGRIPIIVHGF